MKEESSQDNLEPIAVVGMAARFPGARNTEQFWENLAGGVESIRFFNPEELEAQGVDPGLLDDPQYVPAHGVLDDPDCFDAALFSFSPREAEITDPQHRILLECSWRALEQAGYLNTHLPTAVFAGCADSSYFLHNLAPHQDLCESVGEFGMLIGNSKDHAATRIGFKLNLKGPAVTVSTACSTSLVAVHMACDCLRDYQADMALAGAVSIRLPQVRGYRYTQGSVNSPDGHCRPFDARAQGTVSGNGAGVVVLKRLDQAREDGDTIHAVILGSAINNDGSDKVGYAAPSVNGQTAVILDAMDMAGVEAQTIGLLEAHGTGTELGDPIEIDALTRAYRLTTDQRQYCKIGSVKSNFGHLDEAAGMAGLIKAILALKHQKIPPSLHFEKPNPHLHLEDSPFQVNHQLCSWPSGPTPRRAGVSSFGIGGTNAHVILEEAPAAPEAPISDRPQLLVLSAMNNATLNQIASDLGQALQAGTNPVNAAHTLSLGRNHLPHRRFALSGDGYHPAGILGDPVKTRPCPKTPETMAFLFPGQGSQHVGMTRILYQREPFYRETLDQCAHILEKETGYNFLTTLFSEERPDLAADQLAATLRAQPILFSVQYALARLWMRWGVEPAVMIGHSLGEFTAACLAGVFTLEQALLTVARRARLMDQAPGGAMLAVSLSPEELEPQLGQDLCLAAVNGSSQVVVSGLEEAVNHLQNQLNDQGVVHSRLKVSHAFHSPMMDQAAQAFETWLADQTLREPVIPFYSCVTGAPVTPQQAVSPAYWASQLRQPVLFHQGLSHLLEDGCHTALEVGPGRTLTTLLRRHPQGADTTVITSLPHAKSDQDEEAHLLQALGEIWTVGAAVNWTAYNQDRPGNRIPLPAYPLARESYWVNPPRKTQTQTEPNPAQWMYTGRWREIAAPAEANLSGGLLLFSNHHPPAQTLAERWRTRGLRVAQVSPGSDFEKLASDHYQVNPDQLEDYLALMEALEGDGFPLNHLVHAWSLGGPVDGEDFLISGFHSLIHLARALDEGPMTHPNGVQLTIFTDGLHAITGDEPMHPEKAALLGAARVIPEEYGFIKCKVVELSPTELDFSQPLADEPGDDLKLTAWRGDRRYAPQLAPLPPGEPAQPLPENGTWLITGGLGSMGLAFARFLAQKTRANLALTSNEPLPERILWEHWRPDATAAHHYEWEWMDHRRNHWDRDLNIQGVDQIPGLKTTLLQFCNALILDYFRSAGASLEDGETTDVKSLRTQLGVRPRFERFFDFMLRALAEDGLVTLVEDRLVFNQPSEHPSSAELKEKLMTQHPAFKGLVNLVEHCARGYQQAFSGQSPAIEVLYPQGSNDLLEESASQTPEHDNDRVYINTLRDILSRAAAGEDHFRILEVGGGAGLMSELLMEDLRHLPVHYHFTDLGRAFVNRAQSLAAERGVDNMSFSVFDITQDPASQGLKPGCYDAVIGYNVVHAVADLNGACANLKSLLKPQGLLAMVETVRQRRWVDMIWGLADGWWYFDDHRTHSPLLEPEAWKHLLKETGFARTEALPRNPAKRETSEAALILAVPSGERPLFPDTPQHMERMRTRLDRLLEIESLGGKILVKATDVTRRDEMTRLVERTRDRFGPIHGVVHAAGKLGQGLMRHKHRKTMDQVLDVKIKGARLLQELIPNPRYFLLCSSLSAVTPIAGQADYSGANAALDALGEDLARTMPGQTASIAWGFWQELGMIQHAELSQVVKDGIQREIVENGWQHMGVRIFEHILKYGQGPRLLVSPANLSEEQPAQNKAEQTLAIHHAILNKGHGGPNLIQFTGTLNREALWVLDEHHVYNHTILPGTAYPDLVHSAVEAWRGEGALQINDLYFLNPLVLDDGETRNMRVTLQPEEGGAACRIISETAPDRWTEHARCQVVFQPDPMPQNLDLAAILGKPHSKGPWQERHAAYPPRWRCLEEAWFEENQGFGLLELNPALAADLKEHPLHPGMLDIATGFLSMEEGFEDGLPFGYRKIAIYGNLPPKILSHARRLPQGSPDAPSYNITLYNLEGQPLMDLEEYTLRRVAPDQDEALQNQRLEIQVPGLLDTLVWRPAPRRAPGPGEVEIQVEAAGLNFIEVLYAHGMLAAPPNAAAGFGLECSGRIARVGEGVSFEPGQEVMALAPASFSCFTTLPATSVAPKPAPLSLEEAACIPSAYTTAWCGLMTKARLVKGERVLIHAASGGVGLAAVHIARMVGARIFATAGTDEKRAYLKSLGVDHVMNSRDLDFAETIMKETGGEGVHVALNSLSGDFIPATLDVMAPHGRFVELGKRDIMAGNNLSLKPFSRFLSYFAVDIGPDMPFFSEVWDQIHQHLDQGQLPPLPHKIFPAETPEAAFAFMAGARHIGKLALGPFHPEALNELARKQGGGGVPLEALLGDLNPTAQPKPRKTSQPTTPAPAPQSARGKRPDLSTAHRAPSTPAEQLLVQIWEELLGVEGIGVDDPFFDLHGDSLLAAQIISRTHQTSGVRLPPSILFDEPTIAGLAVRLDQAGWGEEEDGEI